MLLFLPAIIIIIHRALDSKLSFVKVRLACRSSLLELSQLGRFRVLLSQVLPTPVLAKVLLLEILEGGIVRRPSDEQVVLVPLTHCLAVEHVPLLHPLDAYVRLLDLGTHQSLLDVSGCAHHASRSIYCISGWTRCLNVRRILEKHLVLHLS